jgi:hypothetical protein
MEAGESHALFGLDLFVAIEWGDLHLRTLQGWQVLHFTFESASCFDQADQGKAFQLCAAPKA